MFRKMLISNTKGNTTFRAVVASILVCFVMVLMAVLAANADTGAVPAAGPDAVKELMDKVVFPFVTGLILSLLSLVLHRLQQKYKLDVLTANQDLIEKAALQGISLAEEQAAKYASRKISGNEKMLIAVDHLKSVVPSVGQEQARRVIEGMLARIPRVGATGDMVVAVQ